MEHPAPRYDCYVLAFLKYIGLSERNRVGFFRHLDLYRPVEPGGLEEYDRVGVPDGRNQEPLGVVRRRRRDYLYAGLCALIVLVLVLAASGVLTGGH